MSDREPPKVWPAWGRYTFFAVLGAILVFGVVSLVRGDHPGAATVRIVVAAVAVPALLRPVQLIAVRRRRARQQRPVAATPRTPPGPDDVTRDGRAFRVQSRWKEEVVYWEGGHGYLFDAGWGVEPHVLYVPTAARWDDVVPAWLRGRRDVVLEALRARSGHVVADDEQGFYRASPARELQA